MEAREDFAYDDGEEEIFWLCRGKGGILELLLGIGSAGSLQIMRYVTSWGTKSRLICDVQILQGGSLCKMQFFTYVGEVITVIAFLIMSQRILKFRHLGGNDRFYCNLLQQMITVRAQSKANMK
jgi:hypothetical protein